MRERCSIQRLGERDREEGERERERECKRHFVSFSLAGQSGEVPRLSWIFVQSWKHGYDSGCTKRCACPFRQSLFLKLLQLETQSALAIATHLGIFGALLAGNGTAAECEMRSLVAKKYFTS